VLRAGVVKHPSGGRRISCISGCLNHFASLIGHLYRRGPEGPRTLCNACGLRECSGGFQCYRSSFAWHIYVADVSMDRLCKREQRATSYSRGRRQAFATRFQRHNCSFQQCGCFHKSDGAASRPIGRTVSRTHAIVAYTAHRTVAVEAISAGNNPSPPDISRVRGAAS